MDNTTVVSAKSGLIKAEGKLVIKDFAEEMAGFKPGMMIESEAFMLGDTPLTIWVYPNGALDEDKGHVSLFLINCGDAEISVKGQVITDLETKNFSTKVVKAQELIWVKFLTHAQCAEAYKEKDFVVEAKLEMLGEVQVIVGKQSASASKKRKLNVWENVYNEMSGADFTLVFEEEEVPCHKHILAAASPVFKAMVENNTYSEAIQSQANIKLSAEVGQAFLRFIYTGEMQEDVMKENAPAFLEMGQMFFLQELKDMAERKLLSQLDKTNMVRLAFLGDHFGAEDIFEAALKMIKINMAWLRHQVYGQS